MGNRREAQPMHSESSGPGGPGRGSTQGRPGGRAVRPSRTERGLRISASGAANGQGIAGQNRQRPGRPHRQRISVPPALLCAPAGLGPADGGRAGTAGAPPFASKRGPPHLLCKHHQHQAQSYRLVKKGRRSRDRRSHTGPNRPQRLGASHQQPLCRPAAIPYVGTPRARQQPAQRARDRVGQQSDPQPEARGPGRRSQKPPARIAQGSTGRQRHRQTAKPHRQPSDQNQELGRTGDQTRQSDRRSRGHADRGQGQPAATKPQADRPVRLQP